MVDAAPEAAWSGAVAGSVVGDLAAGFRMRGAAVMNREGANAVANRAAKAPEAARAWALTVTRARAVRVPGDPVRVPVKQGGQACQAKERRDREPRASVGRELRAPRVLELARVASAVRLAALACVPEWVPADPAWAPAA